MSKVETPLEDAPKRPVALIAGPTASGKSDCAVDLALALKERGRRGVVVNADSQQVYRDLRVLSARPSAEEMRGIEHRLYGTWDGSEACSAAEWSDAAKREIATLHAEDAVPILCGGTGLYIRTLLDGIAPVPPIDPEIRESVRALGQSEAYAALKREDPERAAQLNPADRQRTARALEVVRSTRRSMLDWQQQLEGGIGECVELYPLILLPARDTLYERCDKRFEAMIETGAINEVEHLLARGLDPQLPVMRAIGVPEIRGYLEGASDREAMIGGGQAATRQYAKRQFTWFRHQPPESWPSRESDNYVLNDIFASLLHH